MNEELANLISGLSEEQQRQFLESGREMFSRNEEVRTVSVAERKDSRGVTTEEKVDQFVDTSQTKGQEEESVGLRVKARSSRAKEQEEQSVHNELVATVETANEEYEDEQSEAEQDSSSNSQGRLSNSSTITIVGDPRFNSQVLLTIDPTKTHGQISLSFTEERSSTSLGSKQGDHTVPERLLLEFIAKTVSGKTLEEIPTALYEAFKGVVEDFDGIELPEDKPQVPLIPGIIPYNEGSSKHEKLGIRFENATNVANYISQIIERYNHLPLSVLPKDGHAASSEGSKVRTNIAMLRAVNEFLDIDHSLGNRTETLDLFYKEAVLTHGRFVNGMKDFFELQNIDQVRERFPDSEEGREHFTREFRSKCNEEQVGKLLSEIFDFPYKESVTRLC